MINFLVTSIRDYQADLTTIQAPILQAQCAVLIAASPQTNIECDVKFEAVISSYATKYEVVALTNVVTQIDRVWALEQRLEGSKAECASPKSCPRNI